MINNIELLEALKHHHSCWIFNHYESVMFADIIMSMGVWIWWTGTMEWNETVDNDQGHVSYAAQALHASIQICLLYAPKRDHTPTHCK